MTSLVSSASLPTITPKRLVACPFPYSIVSPTTRANASTSNMSPWRRLSCPGRRRLRYRFGELSGIDRHVILDLLDVNHRGVRGADGQGGDQERNLYAFDVAVVAVIRLNRIVTHRRCVKRSLAQQ